MSNEIPASLRQDDNAIVEWAASPSDWDDFVRAHPWGTVYHLTAWQRVLQEAFPHIEGRFLLLRDPVNGRLLGGMPLYTVKSWLLGDRLVSIPFSSFCDPLVPSGRHLVLLVEEAKRFAELHKLPNLQIRLLRASSLAEEAGFSPSRYSLHHVTDLRKPADELWASFSEGSVKRRIRRAAKAGIVISSNLEDSALRDFTNMLSDNRRRHALPHLPFRFFEALRRNLGPELLSLWLARGREGKPLAGLLGWRLDNRFAVEYAADFFEARAVGANQFLSWHVMHAMRSSGCVSFSFGRTGLDNEGLRLYKRHWGTVEESLTMIFLPKLRADLLEQNSLPYGLAKSMLAHSPKALYKSLGGFFYRHMG